MRQTFPSQKPEEYCPFIYLRCRFEVGVIGEGVKRLHSYLSFLFSPLTLSAPQFPLVQKENKHFEEGIIPSFSKLPSFQQKAFITRPLISVKYRGGFFFKLLFTTLSLTTFPPSLKIISVFFLSEVGFLSWGTNFSICEVISNLVNDVLLSKRKFSLRKVNLLHANHLSIIWH